MYKGENRISFNVFDEQTNTYSGKFFAFALPLLSSELHKGNGHRVRFNSDSNNPHFLERIEGVELPKSTQRSRAVPPRRARRGSSGCIFDRAGVHPARTGRADHGRTAHSDDRHRRRAGLRRPDIDAVRSDWAGSGPHDEIRAALRECCRIDLQRGRRIRRRRSRRALPCGPGVLPPISGNPRATLG
jgi:hypothetical protein